MLRFFKRKPAEVEAWQFHGENIVDLPKSWGPVGTPMGDEPFYVDCDGLLYVETPVGAKQVCPKDWIVKGADGGFRIHAPETFDQMFEELP